jgi:hypothetical protein
LKYILYIALLFSVSCSNSKNGDEINETTTVEQNSEAYEDKSGSNSDEKINDQNSISENFPDDIYSADVEYYNPNTGRNSYYTLDVEVVDNIVTVIHFSNGGWLDETHIVSGGELDVDGTTTIYTDKGYEYTVTVKQ